MSNLPLKSVQTPRALPIPRASEVFGISPRDSEPPTIVPPRVTPLLDRSPEAVELRAAVAREAFARMRAIRNEPGEDDAAFLRELDESHPDGLGLERFYTDGSGLA